jgi:hypothetical protein
MPTPPAAWESATPVFGIRYPKPTAPAKYLPDMFQHTGVDVEQALIANESVPPGLIYVTGTKAQRLVAPPVKDQVWVETDTGDQYIGTGAAWRSRHRRPRSPYRWDPAGPRSADQRSACSSSTAWWS